MLTPWAWLPLPHGYLYRITEERAREDLMLARATIAQALTTLTEDQLIRR